MLKLTPMTAKATTVTIQLELSESIYDRVISFLELLPKNECHILETPAAKNQSLREAFDAALLTNVFADIDDPSAWERGITSMQHFSFAPPDSKVPTIIVETLSAFIVPTSPTYEKLFKVLKPVTGYSQSNNSRQG